MNPARISLWLFGVPLLVSSAACTLTPSRSETRNETPGRPIATVDATHGAGAPTAAPTARAVPVTPATAAPVTARAGGYYQDDGPARDTPENLDRTPDAVPRLEVINKGTARPYEVLGKSYTPYTTLRPFKQRGLASWYGKKYHGRKTSSGERYDMFAMTAAHTLLPLPSYLRVTNLSNGRQVIVRVNDRGPFHQGRVVDLSYTAAHKLGLIGKGSGEVEIEQIIPGGNDAPVALVAAKVPDPVSPPPDEVGSLIAQLPKDNSPPPPGVYIQLGAFGNPDNAENLRNILGRELEWLAEPIHVVSAGNIHRVQVGPYPDRGSADRAAAKIIDEMGGKPTFVSR